MSAQLRASEVEVGDPVHLRYLASQYSGLVQRNKNVFWVVLAYRGAQISAITQQTGSRAIDHCALSLELEHLVDIKNLRSCFNLVKNTVDCKGRGTKQKVTR